jgi:Predicted membrane protein
MKTIIHILFSALAIFVAVYFIPGVAVDKWETYLILTIVFGAINIFVKPVLTLLTLPLSIITLGLFSIVINALMVMLADKIVPGFSVDGFLSALFFGLVFGVTSFVLKRFD